MIGRKIFALVFVALLILSPVYVYAEAETVMVNHPEAKIRNGPATSYIVLWKPRLYTPLEVLAKFTDEVKQLWYIVRDVEGDVGWIHYSTVEKKVGAIVTANTTNVMKEPSGNSQVLFQAPKNYTFKVVQSNSKWYKVEDPDGDKGWVANPDVWTGRTPQVKKSSPEPASAPAPTKKK
ncbi:MAG: SH3 domain-containing protein [Nitrospinota bacterium]|nr:SH3 domain-containing protein [Nitrospinota bacterium]